MSVTNDVHGNADYEVKYRVMWKHEVDNFTAAYVVSAQSPEGFIVEEKTDIITEQHEVLMLNYSAEYDVLVTAVYRLPLNQTVAMASEAKAIATFTGRPDPVSGLKVEQCGCSHSIIVSWERPVISRGNLDGYELKVTDDEGAVQYRSVVYLIFIISPGTAQHVSLCLRR